MSTVMAGKRPRTYAIEIVFEDSAARRREMLKAAPEEYRSLVDSHVRALRPKVLHKRGLLK